MNRTDVINLVCGAINAKSYLEIGVFTPSENYNLINCPYKIGLGQIVNVSSVLPITSDQFFDRLSDDIRFDVIFIDGDHRYEQVCKDIDNSINHLSKDGVIVVHDVNPMNEMQALPEKPASSAIWCGEAWRAYIEYTNNTNFQFVTVDCDFGVGLIRKIELSSDKGYKADNLSHKSKIDQLNYNWLTENKKTALNLIPPDKNKILKFLGFSTAIYYTDLSISDSIRTYCFEKLLQNKSKTELIVVTPKTTSQFNQAEVVITVGPKPRNHISIYEQILLGLEKARFDRIFLVEHDVLYPESYFGFVPTDKSVFHYNRNTYHMNTIGFFKANPLLTSNFCGDKNNLITAIDSRLSALRSGSDIIWTEPGLGNLDDFTTDNWVSKYPTIDIRHGSNFTGMRESKNILKSIPYWGNHHRLCQNLGMQSII